MTRWMLVSRCGKCKDPTPFDICSFLGYNPGIDGHLFKSYEEAQDALDLCKKAIINTGFEVELETVGSRYNLSGPLMQDGNFWRPETGVMHGGHENPCIIMEKRGQICHNVNIIDKVLPVEVEFKI